MGKKDDFNFDDIFDDDASLENIFDDDTSHKNDEKKKISPVAPINDNEFTISEELEEELGLAAPDANPEPPATTPEKVKAPTKKRTLADFEPDMDVILLTAQSAMINEGMKLYVERNFSASTLKTYIEASNGIELYIRILDRNPDNYRKLKDIIDSDMDCQEVELTAFSLYKRVYHERPETDPQKVKAFEMCQKLIREAVNKSSISYTNTELKEYFLMTGSLDEEMVSKRYKTGDSRLRMLIQKLNQQMKIALNISKRKNPEIVRGLRGKDVNTFIVKSSSLLTFFYRLEGNNEAVNYYDRIQNIYKKYFVIRD